jgi:sulfate transport system permease protein
VALYPYEGMTMRSRSQSVLPGFGLSLGITCTYLSLMVLLPLATVFVRTAELSGEQFWSTVTDPRVVASYRVTLSASFVAAALNTVFGLLVAWVLVRYRFPGRRLVDAMVDLPFALPTAVAGIALTTLYTPNGSVVFISGNMPMKTEIVPLLIITKLEQYDYAGATAVAMVMLLLSFVLLLAINLLQWAARRRMAV